MTKDTKDTKDTTEFKLDFETGNIGVDIFTNRFIDQERTFSVSSNKEDYDLSMNGTTYELKTNYKDDGKLVVEEWYDRDKGKKGWIVTTKSDYIVFISKKTKTMLIYPTNLLKLWYKENHPEIQKNYELHENKISIGLHGDTWISEYRRIPIKEIGVKPIVLKGV